MSEKMENPSVSNGYSAAALQDHVTSGVNDSRTGEIIDTRLTQAGSGRVPRPRPVYLLDCKVRRAKDPVEQMQAEIAKAATEQVLLYGATDVLRFLDRQMTEVMK
jgi:hypothetical protein